MSNNTISNIIRLISSEKNAENLSVTFIYQGVPCNIEFLPPETYSYKNGSPFILFCAHMQKFCLQERVIERNQNIKNGIISKLSSCVWKQLPKEFKREFKKYYSKINRPRTSKIVIRDYIRVAEKKLTKLHEKHHCSERLIASDNSTNDNINNIFNNKNISLEAFCNMITDSTSNVCSLENGFAGYEEESVMINPTCHPLTALDEMMHDIEYVQELDYPINIFDFRAYESVSLMTRIPTPLLYSTSQPSTALNRHEVRGSSEFDVNFRFSYEMPPAHFLDYSQNKNIKQACNTEFGLEMHNMEVYSRFNGALDFCAYDFPTLISQNNGE
ncbi:1974_t:CDS:1 [Dentiscutata heterogama]|uniref:1974_t:CDS:1 n=1 Tax=Dentiscutata heterogama TaxID=1316150 RepID=A0ACA9LM14_9GLOM|nr:1974_t:CDS:1 [Dentiscutata heterogama]